MNDWKRSSRPSARTSNDARAKADLAGHWLLVVLLCLAPSAQAQFRLPPYVQNPTPSGVTLIWLSEEEVPGEVLLKHADGAPLAAFETVRSRPLRADSLAYHPSEPMPGRMTLPFHHEVRIGGLEPGRDYRFVVRQGSATMEGTFATVPKEPRPLRFIVFGDSETEPESVGKPAHWPRPGSAPGRRVYPVDQERGYRENLAVIRARAPDFVAIAGDLVESGGEQRDWDEFWRLTGPLAATTPIFPAPGNHEYYAGPGEKGRYTELASERGFTKYRAYFDLPANGMGPHHERYYRVDWGPVTLLVLDLGNGVPHRSERDGNWYLKGEGEGGFAPSWAPGSRQYRWLEAALAAARFGSAFTFVMFHYCPYSSGPHGQPPGDGEGQDMLSGVPLRALTPLFQRYGVDALLTGHDEMYEHSVLPGSEELPDGSTIEYELHVYDVGIGGDGLRGPVPGVENPHRRFLAHDDAPEIRDADGRLIDGGKHYGHLEINVTPLQDGSWQARLDPVYLFPVTDAAGRVVRFERRLYDDALVLSSRKPATEEPSE
jgi:hypothetical protein